MNFTAKKIYTLEPNKDLLPGKGVLAEDANPIMALHCIIPPNAEVVIRTITGQVIKFPPAAFVCGAIYPYEIRQVNEIGAACFLGLSD